MTQEQIHRARQILQNNGIEQLDKDDYFFKSIIKSMNDYAKEQPTPQDINKWIEDEAEKYCNNIHGAHSNSRWEGAFDAFIVGAQLLFPELQQLREWKRQAMKVMPDMQAIGKALGIKLGETVHDKILSGIEQQKSQIDELKNALNHELEVHKEFIEQAAEIESLKKEIGELKEINEGLRLSRNEYREAWENRYGKTT